MKRVEQMTTISSAKPFSSRDQLFFDRENKVLFGESICNCIRFSPYLKLRTLTAAIRDVGLRSTLDERTIHGHWYVASPLLMWATFSIPFVSNKVL